MTDLNPIDRAALDLAIATARRDPLERRRIDSRLAKGEDYGTVGRGAAFSCQIDALGLEPWMSPPCYADMRALNQPYGDPGARRESAELATRMRRCNVSRWHPDPARECDRVEAERAKIQTAK
jgi:hypothetical protein